MSRAFGSTQALSDVSIELYGGEIHALLGENGAGKSTLIKIMTGVQQPDTGEILIDGQPVRVASSQDAQRLGVAAIYQEPMIFPDLSVAENIFIGHRNRGRIVDRRRMRGRPRRSWRASTSRLDVGAPGRGLTLAEQQTVEIAKAISLDVRVLIMDEPTASLSAHEVHQLFRIVRRAATRRASRSCSSPTAWRRCSRSPTGSRSCATAAGSRPRRVGELTPAARHPGHGRPRGRGAVPPHRRRTRARCAWRSRACAARACSRTSSFDLRAGEVLGFAGLVGARRTDVGPGAVRHRARRRRHHRARRRADHGPEPPGRRSRLGIAYTTEDRRQLGLVFPLSHRSQHLAAVAAALPDAIGPASSAPPSARPPSASASG